MKTSDKSGSGQRREEERCQKRTLVIDLLNPAAADAVDDDDEEVGAACPLLFSQRGWINPVLNANSKPPNDPEKSQLSASVVNEFSRNMSLSSIKYVGWTRKR